MAGNRNLMNHCRNESSGIERYVGTSYDHLVRVSENLDKINFIAANIDSILDGVIVTTGDVIGTIQKEGENMLAGIQKDLERYLKMFEKDMDIMVSEKFQFLDETLTGLEHNSEFAIRQKEFEARVDKVEQVIANEKQVNASQRETLTAQYNENKASLEDFREVIAKEKEVASNYYNKVDLNLYEGNVKLEEMKNSILTAEEARINTENFLSASIEESKASIKDLNNIIVDNTRSITETLNTISGSVGDNSAEIEDLKKVTVTLEKSTAESIESLKSSIKDIQVTNNGEQIKLLESEILLERLTETTNTQTSTTVNSLQNSIMGANSANLSLQQMTLANESEVRASQTTFLTAGYNDNTANLLLQQSVIANEVSTRASEHRKLTAHYQENVALIEEFRTVYAADKVAMSESLDKLKSEVNTEIKGELETLKKSFNSEITAMKKTYSTDKEATAQTIDNLKSEINTSIKGDIDSLRTQVNSEISSVRKTVADLEKSTAESSTSLKSEIIATIDNDINTAKKDLTTTLTKDTTSKISASEKKTTNNINTAIANSEKKTNAEIAGLKTQVSKVEQTFNNTLGTSVADLEKQIFNTNTNLTKEIEKATPQILDTRNDNQPPSWYYANYPKKTVTEFKRAQTMGLGSSPTYCNVTTVVQWGDPSGGGITQTAIWNDKTYTRSGGKSASNDTWTAWLLLEDANTSTTKANNAKAGAIADSKKYTDAEASKIQTKVTAEINQVNKTLTDINGNVAAMTSLTATTTVNGNKVVSGLAFGSNGKQASFKVFANNFAIVSTDGKVEIPAFTSTMVGGVARVGINGNLFVAGSLDANVLRANTTLTSPNIVGGQLNIGGGRFVVNSSGEVNIKSHPSKNIGLQITNDRIDVYDESGKLRVRIGRLT